MSKKGALIGLGVGAGLMFVLDPQLGRRRRALARDKVVHAWNTSRRAVTRTSQDLVNRTYGFGKGITYLVHKDKEEAEDDVLRERVRARMGHAIAHPGAITVTVSNGIADMSGDVLSSEMPDLIAAVKSVPGVRDVENRLRVHEEVGNIPALQGEGKPGPRGILKRNLAPSTRLLMGTAGGALALYGIMKRGVAGTLMSSAGMSMVARGVYPGAKAQKIAG